MMDSDTAMCSRRYTTWLVMPLMGPCSVFRKTSGEVFSHIRASKRISSTRPRWGGEGEGRGEQEGGGEGGRGGGGEGGGREGEVEGKGRWEEREG